VNVDIEKEDEAEKITRLEHNKQSKRDLRIAAACFAMYLVARLLHSTFGLPFSVTEANQGFAVMLGVIFFVHLFSLLTIWTREMRERSKETRRRLTAIERNLTCRKDDFDEAVTFEDDAAKEADITATVARYHELAKQGDQRAQFNLGAIYYRGNEVPKDSGQSTYWFRKAAEQGHELSQLLLARLCVSGGASSSSYDDALYWYRKLAEQGSKYRRIGEYNIGKMYASGVGLPKDYTEAVRWWRKSADHGWRWANYKLGQLYTKGASGVPPDYGEAYFRLYIALDGEGIGVIQNLALSERDNLSDHLDQEALSKAQDRGKEWLKYHQSEIPSTRSDQVRCWYSHEHEIELRSVDSAEAGLMLEINGQRLPYTSASPIDALEPFPGALNKYPDYREQGVAEVPREIWDRSWTSRASSK
jgi:TPR repeat protein